MSKQELNHLSVLIAHRLNSLRLRNRASEGIHTRAMVSLSPIVDGLWIDTINCSLLPKEIFGAKLRQGIPFILGLHGDCQKIRQLPIEDRPCSRDPLEEQLQEHGFFETFAGKRQGRPCPRVRRKVDYEPVAESVAMLVEALLPQHNQRPFEFFGTGEGANGVLQELLQLGWIGGPKLLGRPFPQLVLAGRFSGRFSRRIGLVPTRQIKGMDEEMKDLPKGRES